MQFQGDRVQALFHLPQGNDERIAARAVEAAIALQSSMELVIKKLLPESRDLGIAVGVSIGTTLVSKLGTRGHRDRICIGDAVEEAAAIQEGSAGGEIAIPSNIHEHLDEDLQKLFAWNSARGLFLSDQSHPGEGRAGAQGQAVRANRLMWHPERRARESAASRLRGAGRLYRRGHTAGRPKAWYERADGAELLRAERALIQRALPFSVLSSGSRWRSVALRGRDRPAIRLRRIHTHLCPHRFSYRLSQE